MERKKYTNIEGKKRKYEKPTIEVIEFSEVPQLLASSQNPSQNSSNPTRPDYNSSIW